MTPWRPFGTLRAFQRNFSSVLPTLEESRRDDGYGTQEKFSNHFAGPTIEPLPE